MQAWRRQHERRMRWEARREQFFDVLPLGGILMLVASGYARKNRVALAGAGLFAIAASAWANREKARQSRLEAEGGTPSERIANTLLLYAVRDGASQIRLRAGVCIVVHYFVGGEWQEQMKIPGYIWCDLCAHFIHQSESWKRPIAFEMDGKRCEFSPHFERERDLPLETLTLSLNI